jgi:ABC-type uncharacterized transport system permease subunit
VNYTSIQYCQLSSKQPLAGACLSCILPEEFSCSIHTGTGWMRLKAQHIQLFECMD